MNLYKSLLPILMIEKRHYPILGSGSEGVVYSYNENIAFKTFENTNDKRAIENKIRKINALGRLIDDNFAFPLGFVSHDDFKLAGYFMKRIKTNKFLKDFYDLRTLNDNSRKLEILLKADNAIKRAHEKGIILADIRYANILIDTNDNPIFIDTDNYEYNGYEIDLKDYSYYYLEKNYSKKFNKKDIDKYLFALLTLESFLNYDACYYQYDDFFKRIIKYSNLPLIAKEELACILSDASNKPYISDVLSYYNPKKDFISENNIKKLKIW